jgi:hypothetical protein
MIGPLNNLRIPVTISRLPNLHHKMVLMHAMDSLSPVVHHIFAHNSQQFIAQSHSRFSAFLHEVTNRQALVRRPFNMPLGTMKQLK